MTIHCIACSVVPPEGPPMGDSSAAIFTLAIVRKYGIDEVSRRLCVLHRSMMTASLLSFAQVDAEAKGESGS